jgi:hypothetical protein
MYDRYQFDINTDGKATNSKKLFFDIMNDTNNKYQSDQKVTLKDMNNITLNIARDYYRTNYKLNKKTSKPAVIKPLERENDLYGPRVLNFEQIKPEMNIRKPVDDQYKQLENNRRREQEMVIPDVQELKPIMESAFDPSEFMVKLNELEKKRDNVEVKDLNSMADARMKQDTNIHNTIQNDPKALYQLTKSSNEIAEKKIIEQESFASVSREDLLPPQVNQMILLDKFLSINGFDRNWLVDKSRFDFRVDFGGGDNSIQQRHRNIKSIKATRVIIPMEILEVQSLQNVPKTYYNYEFSFSYPYIMLYIDEFGDIYDGTNDNVRRCFCHLVFDKCYKAPNGRGYIILNPIQNEKKVFHPTPLTALSKMSVSLRKPNGELLNSSRDEYLIFKVEYEAYNKQYLKIVTNKYFDKNEFFRGDTIILKNFEITNVPTTPPMNNDAITKLNDFINRKEGHEILEIGQANDSGYFQTYYINAPGGFDTTAGKYVLDTVLLDNLILFNNTIDYSSWTGTNGSILNTSLQCTLTFKLQALATDPSIVDISYGAIGNSGSLLTM